jgi:hypothetical protein
MATSELTAIPNQDDNAAFRAWGQQVAASLEAAGLVQTADTGQINWSTVTIPTGGNQSRGYEVYCFDDDLQATAPVFIRIDYGSNGNGGSYPGMKLHVGTVTDGAGNLNTAGTYMSDQFSSNNSISSGSVPRDIWASGGDGYVHLVVWPGGTNVDSNLNAVELHIERTKDATGADTAEAILVMVGGGDSHRYYALRYDSPGAKSYNSYGNAPYRDESRVKGTDVFFTPLFMVGQSGEAKLYGPFHDLLLYYVLDVAGHPDVTINHYGEDHTYRLVGQWSSQHVHVGNSLSGSACLAMRWE